MATSAEPRPRRRASTRRLTGKIAALAAAASVLLGGGLSWEMAHGADPALQPKATASTATAIPRRIVKTVVVRRVISSAPSASSASSSIATSTPVAATAAPVTSGTS